jgi:hypothetical protein
MYYFLQTLDMPDEHPTSTGQAPQQTVIVHGRMYVVCEHMTPSVT